MGNLLWCILGITCLDFVPITYSHLYFLECFSTGFFPNLELFIQCELLCVLQDSSVMEDVVLVAMITRRLLLEESEMVC
jgi:hypothetical protein